MLYKCARYYGRAESDQDFETARGVLAECLLRRFVAVPTCPIRVAPRHFEDPGWIAVAEAALAVCHADPIFYGDDVTVPLLKLQDIGEKWTEMATWTPEPWRK